MLCDLDDLKDYEKVKSRLFIRLLNADKNRTILKELVHHKIGDIALVVYYLAGEKEGYVLSAKIKKSFVEKWGKDADTVFEAALINTYFISHQEFIIGKKCCLIRHMKEIISWISLEHTIQIKGLPGIA